MINFSIKDVHIGDRLYCMNNIGNYKKGEIYTVSDTSFFNSSIRLKEKIAYQLIIILYTYQKKEQLESNPKSMTKEEIEDELGYKIKITSK